MKFILSLHDYMIVNIQNRVFVYDIAFDLLTYNVLLAQSPKE